jgi:hypothetical protein
MGVVMPVRRSVRFTKRGLVQAVDAVLSEGLQIASIRIEPDGTILVIPGTPSAVASSEPNP